MSRIRFLMGLFAAVGLIVSMALPVGAGTMLNTIGDTATLSRTGHSLEATVVIGCKQGERVRFALTVTQGETVGTARGAGRCAGDPDGQVHEVTVAGAKGDTFEPGRAEATAWAEPRHGQHTHPRRTWSKAITIE